MSRNSDGRASGTSPVVGEKLASLKGAPVQGRVAQPDGPTEVITSGSLTGLLRELQHEGVLTVYVAPRTADPAMRNAWRTALEQELRNARAALASATAAEREAFEKAADAMHAHLPAADGAPSVGPWAGFFTAGGVAHVVSLPLQLSTRVAWRQGPTLAPAIRTLKRHRPIGIAVVDSRSARFFRSVLGRIEELPALALQAEEPPVMAGGGTGTGTSVHAPRSAVATEQAQELRRTVFRRMSATLPAHLMEVAGKRGWMVIVGPSEWSRLAAESLPASTSGRVAVVTSLAHDVGPSEILTAAERSVSELRAASEVNRVDMFMEEAGALGRATKGIPATQTALHALAVEQMILSPHFVDAQPALAEDLVRAALLQGAEIEVASGSAVAKLDHPGVDGVVTRLRYPQSAAGGWAARAEEGAAPPAPAAG